MGVGARHTLFPMHWHLALVLLSRESGCQLPDANLHGKWSFRPLSRADRAVTRRGFSGEASSLHPDRSSLAPVDRTTRTAACKALPLCALNPGSATSFEDALAPGYGSCLLPLRLSSLYSQAKNGFPSARSRRFLSGFACRTRSPRLPCPCVFRTRLGTFRRGRLANPASACWFPVTTVTLKVTGIEGAGRNLCLLPSSLRSAADFSARPPLRGSDPPPPAILSVRILSHQGATPGGRGGDICLRDRCMKHTAAPRGQDTSCT